MNELHLYFEQLNTYIIKILVQKKDYFLSKWCNRLYLRLKNTPFFGFGYKAK